MLVGAVVADIIDKCLNAPDCQFFNLDIPDTLIDFFYDFPVSQPGGFFGAGGHIFIKIPLGQFCKGDIPATYAALAFFLKKHLFPFQFFLNLLVGHAGREMFGFAPGSLLSVCTVSHADSDLKTSTIFYG